MAKNNIFVKLSNKKHYTPDFSRQYSNKKLKSKLKRIMTKRNRLKLKNYEIG